MELIETLIYDSNTTTEFGSRLFTIVGAPDNFKQANALIVPAEIRESLYYNKVLTESVINFLLKVINSLDRTVIYDSLTTKSNLPDRMLLILSELSNLLQWFTNSTSWNTGDFKSYDKNHIRNKLENILKMF